MKNSKKIVAVILAAVLLVVAAFAGCSGAKDTKKGESAEIIAREEIKSDVKIPEDFKIGLICLHDENSTYDKNFIDGLKSAAKGMGLTDEQVIVVTNIGEDAACYDTAVDLAKNKGCKVVFADSFGHESFMMRAAKEFPEVEFCHATGTSAKGAGLKNFHNAFAAIYEGRYIAGVAAGIKLNDMIKEGKITAEQAIIGYVGAFTYAEVISGMTSFFLGARSVCPSATMKVRYTGSWYDQAKEQEAATALIEKDKCVLLSQHADSLGAPTACELAGVPNVSYNGSTYSAGKNTFIVSSAINWAPYFQYIIEQSIKGEAIDTNWCGTIATNSVVISGINQDVVDGESTIEELNKVVDQFKAGKLHVYDTSTFTVTVDKKNNVNVNATVDKDGHLTEYLADVDGDFVGETNVVHDGYFDESGSEFRSAPYFDIIIDGITNINVNFG
ncbi:MAG: BMP family ABC transporter substrate-binding protein [Ruminococcaceae bacterium]|nr:BMP family ABC transporter substrate-binding protein [Oscillospiraceae bacterium]